MEGERDLELFEKQMSAGSNGLNVMSLNRLFIRLTQLSTSAWVPTKLRFSILNVAV